jgi:hypothetical protein
MKQAPRKWNAIFNLPDVEPTDSYVLSESACPYCGEDLYFDTAIAFTGNPSEAPMICYNDECDYYDDGRFK